MKIVSFDVQTGRPVDSYGSLHLNITHMARLSGNGSAVVMHLDPGGRVGGHPTVGQQLFLVVAGSGQVSGGDHRAQPIRAGQAALWDPGEWHETITDRGLTAVVIESEKVQLQVG